MLTPSSCKPPSGIKTKKLKKIREKNSNLQRLKFIQTRERLGVNPKDFVVLEVSAIIQQERD